METLHHLLHPHHVSFLKGHTSLHTLHQHNEDPYYGIDKRPSHAGVSAPRFDVREGASAWVLDGEIPGLTSMGDVIAEFVEDQVLVVRGTVKPKGIPTGEKLVSIDLPVAFAHGGSGEDEAAKNGKDDKDSKDSEQLTWKLKERHVGRFERSFTFPGKINPLGMKTSLEAGILSIVLPKNIQATEEAKARQEIESEI